MRITGGTWGSRRVVGPGRDAALRPTPDALREQAFAVLVPGLAGAAFLDLFAGTGVNSLEALSRGAGRAVLVERAAGAVQLIRRNFAALAVPDGAWELVARDAAAAVASLGGRGLRFDVVWCDPPFREWEQGTAALARAREAGVVATGAAVVLEAPPKVVPVVVGFTTVRRLRGAFLLRVE